MHIRVFPVYAILETTIITWPIQKVQNFGNKKLQPWIWFYCLGKKFCRFFTFQEPTLFMLYIWVIYNMTDILFKAIWFRFWTSECYKAVERKCSILISIERSMIGFLQELKNLIQISSICQTFQIFQFSFDPLLTLGFST